MATSSIRTNSTILILSQQAGRAGATRTDSTTAIKNMATSSIRTNSTIFAENCLRERQRGDL